MQAIRLFHHRKPLAGVAMPDPQPDAGEVVVEIRAAGICHSDAHYRADFGRATLPVTLGHEIAGIVRGTGEGVVNVREGDRVALHYLISCGTCARCRRYGEQFCVQGEMLGKDRDGGYAEKIVVPAANAIPVPDEVSFPEAAVMMCSTATAFHALRLADISHDDSVAILGFGGLGASAVQLAGVFGAREIYAIDIVRAKLDLAETFGAEPIEAARNGFRDALLAATNGGGVDVVVDFTGNTAACGDALRSLAPGGRLMLVALDTGALTFNPYADILGRERRIIGSSDHTRAELVELMELARRGDIDLARVITRTVPLEADAINDVLDDLDRGTAHLRSVIDRAAPAAPRG
ncbi:MAG TPA: alcohol dehydrogenase catalytic domain-containing protein [Thermoanaerobaculia bacterium]|nr:alcohol dehydrogenase catalytic domain-containing protein [Thermoanaerobaculia bacterium]